MKEEARFTQTAGISDAVTSTSWFDKQFGLAGKGVGWVASLRGTNMIRCPFLHSRRELRDGSALRTKTGGKQSCARGGRRRGGGGGRRGAAGVSGRTSCLSRHSPALGFPPAPRRVGQGRCWGPAGRSALPCPPQRSSPPAGGPAPAPGAAASPAPGGGRRCRWWRLGGRSRSSGGAGGCRRCWWPT